MKLFNSQGMMIIPIPEKKKKLANAKKILVVKECFCQNGHNLISSRTQFDEHEGIIVKVKSTNGEGMVALSPVYGDKSRISLDIDLVDNEIVDICCPACDSKLPVFSSCECGGDFIALFITYKSEYSNCIGICNRVGCPEAVIHDEGELITLSMINR